MYVIRFTYHLIVIQREAGGKGASEQGEATPFPLPWNEVEQGSESPTQCSVRLSAHVEAPAPCLFFVNMPEKDSELQATPSHSTCVYVNILLHLFT
jgi:hypothetical protein